MDSGNPEVYVLAGPNGAGKTTVAEQLLPDTLGVQNFVNADFIARAISPHAPDTSAIEAGRSMLQRLRELRKQRMTFGFETTLASKTFGAFLRQAQSDGYLVHLIFIYLRDPELAVHRVRLRVEQGGHDLPEDTIRRRYGRGIRNFFRIYRPLADTWTVCDNSGEGPTQVANGRPGTEPKIVDPRAWEHLQRQGTSREH